MLREAIDRVADLATKASAAAILPIDGDKEKVVIACNGDLITHELPKRLTPARDHNVLTLDDIVEVVKNHGHFEMLPVPTEGDTGKAYRAATIWHTFGKVTALLNNPYITYPNKTDRVSMGLTISPPFERLTRFDQQPTARHFDQKALIRLLKIDLGDYGEFDALIGVLRNIKFTAQQGGDSNVQHGRESMGRTIDAAVTGADAIPESFDVVCPVYVNPDLVEITAKIKCHLEIDVPEQIFVVTPSPADLLAAKQHIHEIIGDKLQELLGDYDAPVYFGSP